MIDPYATHLQPLVRAALAVNGGPFLELGCGDYSTPVLAEIARAKGTRLTVMTSAPKWAARFNDLAEIRMVVDWMAVTFPSGQGLVLLDNEQKTAARIRHLPALRAVSRCVVVHDLEQCELQENWHAMIAGYQSIERFQRYMPGTGILWA